MTSRASGAAIVERRSLHLDVISKVELSLERPSRDTVVEIFVLVFVALAALPSSGWEFQHPIQVAFSRRFLTTD
jgi:hypothetical protein